jgi:hypothetical protein
MLSPPSTVECGGFGMLRYGQRVEQGTHDE